MNALRDVFITGTGAVLPGERIGNDRMEDFIGRIGGRPSAVGRRALRWNGIEGRHYALNADGANVAKHMIVLERPIKTLGIFDVKVSLHPEVSVNVKVNVARSPDEAELQSQGVDVMAAMFEQDVSGFTEAYDPNAEPGEIAVEEAEVEGEEEA